MATLDEAPAQLQHWINELDREIAERVALREKLMPALEAFGTAPAPRPTAAVAPKPAKPPTDAAARRAADAQRKRESRSKGQPATGRSKYDYVEVARVANAAVRGGISPTQAVKQRFEISDAMATYLIKTARNQGHEIARLGANKPLKVAPTNVTPINKPGPDPSARAFTPDDAQRLLDNG